MHGTLSSDDVRNLVENLRQTAVESMERALGQDEECYMLCLDAALANDAADALEILLAERVSARPVAAARRFRVVS